MRRLVFWGALLLCLGALVTLFQRFHWLVVPGEFDALEPSIPGKTRLVVDAQWRVARILKGGDIVVLDVPGSSDSARVLGRVVAVGGDLLERDGSLLVVNGEVSGDPFPGAAVQTGVVPDGRVLLLNSHLDSSYPDSRTWGLVSEKRIRARVVLTLRPD